jgi:uncharacterized RDD family membrane protein YckC
MTSSQSNSPGDGQPDGRDLWRILQDDSEPDSADGDLTSGKPDKASGAKAESATQPRSDAEPARSHGGVTRIERILSDPESLESEVDYRAVVQQTDEDFDTAVLSFYRDSDAAVTCKNHPNTASADQCPECQAYFCQNCLVVRRGRLLCRDCATALYVPSEEEILAAQEFGIMNVAVDVAPEEHPEFQVSGGMLGLEGRPSHPFKRLMALVIDILLTRGIVLLLAWIAGGMLGQQPGVFYHLFDNQPDSATLERVFNAVVLLRPVMPWLVVFAMVDFLYFFLSLSFTNRTLGMSWLGCRVVTEWGDFAGFGVVALRTLVFMVCLGWPAILLGWFFPAFRGPHDYAAGTVVINYSGNKRIDSYDTVQIKLD